MVHVPCVLCCKFINISGDYLYLRQNYAPGINIRGLLGRCYFSRYKNYVWWHLFLRFKDGRKILQINPRKY